MVEFQKRRDDVVRYLRGQPGRRATRNQLIKRVGFTPDFRALMDLGVLRLRGEFDHFELVEQS